VIDPEGRSSSLLFCPATSECLEQTDRRAQAVVARLHEQEVCRELAALCIQLLQVGRVAGAMAIARPQQRSFKGVPLLPEYEVLLARALDCSERVFDLAEGVERNLAIQVRSLISAGAATSACARRRPPLGPFTLLSFGFASAFLIARLLCLVRHARLRDHQWLALGHESHDFIMSAFGQNGDIPRASFRRSIRLALELQTHGARWFTGGSRLPSSP
jgi:hypothetical protein